jgi:PBP1b-binding outer membrane lipoprotein LpoB
MNKAIILVILVLAVCAMFFSGCVAPPAGGINITSDKDAASTIADVSTDISGIANSLNEIDKTFTDQNTP